MSFLSGLGAFSGGAVQGAEAGAQLRQRAQALQQGQMALDQEKKRLAAQAAAFANLGGLGDQQQGGGAPGAQQPPQQPPTAMPMQPGQASVPSQPQGQQAFPIGPSGSTAPPPQGGGGSLQSQQGQQQPGGQGGYDPMDPQAPIKMVMQVAREIKARNPNIDPQTLFQATGQIIDMSKGVAPALRQGAQVVVQQMRDQTSMANTAARVGATERGQDIGAQNVQARIGSQEKIAGGHDAASLQRVAQQGQMAMERTQANIAAANQRASQGVWSREKATAYKEKVTAASNKLRSATSRLTSLTNMGAGADDPRVTAAADEAQRATAEMDRVNKAADVEGQQTSSPAIATGGGAPRPTATNAQGQKVEWDGQQWRPVGK